MGKGRRKKQVRATKPSTG